MKLISLFFLSLVPLVTAQTSITPVVPQVIAGGSHSVALDSDGHVWTWGDNTYGQLGVGKKKALFPKSTVPQLVSYLSDAGIRIVSIAAGNSHTLALSEDGALYGWGRSIEGQVGYVQREGTVFQITNPTNLNALGFSDILDCSNQFEAHLDEDGNDDGIPDIPDSPNGPPLAVQQETNVALYQVTKLGGEAGCGTVIARSSASGQFGAIYAFTGPDGRYPVGALVLRNDFLYGMTLLGGAYDGGTLFRVRRGGTEFSVLHHFDKNSMSSNGKLSAVHPQSQAGGLTLDMERGHIYGVLPYGGRAKDGQVFQVRDLDYAPIYSVVVEMDNDVWGTTGFRPVAGVTLGHLYSGKRTIYGTCAQGGASRNGVIFQARVEVGAIPIPVLPTVIHHFTDSNGNAPLGRLTLREINPNRITNTTSRTTRVWQPIFGPPLASDQLVPVLYGTTAKGGSEGNGTFFMCVPDCYFDAPGRQLKTLRSFPSSSSATAGTFPVGDLARVDYPAGGTTAPTLYGVAEKHGPTNFPGRTGTVFKLVGDAVDAEKWSQPTVVRGFYRFDPYSNSQSPIGLTAHNGTVYGATKGDKYAKANQYLSPMRIRELPMIEKIAAAGNHSLAVTSQRLHGQQQVWGWGHNNKGQLGVGDITARPRPTLCDFEETDLDLDTSIADIAAGADFSLLVRFGATGGGPISSLNPLQYTVYGTGHTASQRLGSLTGNAFSFRATNLMSLAPIRLSAGAAFTTVHDPSADPALAVYATGSNSRLQIMLGYTEASGFGYLTPDIRFNPLTAGFFDLSQISCGSTHVVALDRFNPPHTAGDYINIRSWADNTFGQLGRNPLETPEKKAFFPIPPQKEAGQSIFPGALAVGAGSNHTLAIDSTGAVWGFGDNTRGQLGPIIRSSYQKLSKIGALQLFSLTGDRGVGFWRAAIEGEFYDQANAFMDFNTMDVNGNSIPDVEEDLDGNGINDYLDWFILTLVDTDNDGLTDFWEYYLGTNPFMPDTDGDGFTDGWEDANRSFGFNPKVFHRGSTTDDNDGDGLSNTREGKYGTDPRVPDTDGDGLTDGAEVNTHETDPLAKDSDQDTLFDRDELTVWNTKPNSYDTDGDTLNDGWEVTHRALGFNPLVPNKRPLATDPSIPTDANGDLDGDGLSNAQEETIGTNPNNTDTDGDSILDFAENQQGSNPNSASDNVPPTEGVDQVSITYGDLPDGGVVGDTSSKSERYRIILSPDDTSTGAFPITHTNREWGVADSVTVQLRRGVTYSLQFQHVDHRPIPPDPYEPDAYRGPDYDYMLNISVAGNRIVSDPDSITGEHGTTGPNPTTKFFAAGKKQVGLVPPPDIQSADVSKGFDFPMQDDPPAEYTVGMPLPIVKDQDNPEWWTSVARTDASGRGLNVCNHVKLVFSSDSHAKLFEIHSTEPSLLFVDGDGSVAGGGLTKMRTQLTLTGRNSTSLTGVQVVDVHIRTRVNKEVVRTLKVLVMPERKVRLRVHFVEDHTVNVGTPQFPRYFSEVPPAYKDVAGIVDSLNTVFRQACLTFYADNPGSGTLDFRGWDFTPDGILNCEQTILNGNVVVDSELPRLQNIPRESGALHILVFRKIKNGTAGGFWDSSSLSNCVFIGAENHQPLGVTPAQAKAIFLRTGAHEVGHALKASVRHRMLNGIEDPHDKDIRLFGYQMQPLMAPETNYLHPEYIWLRHEEWRPLWNNAIDYVLP